MDWLDLFAVQGTLKSILQHHSSKASILQHSAFFIVQLSHPYMTTGKIIALTRWTFVGKVMSLLFSMLCRLIITFLPRSKSLLISWLQSPSAVILEPRKIKSVIVSNPTKYKISSVQLLSHVQLHVTPWTAAPQASLSITNSWSLLKLISFESVMPSNLLILCCPFLLLPSIFPSIRVFSNESPLLIR